MTDPQTFEQVDELARSLKAQILRNAVKAARCIDEAAFLTGRSRSAFCNACARYSVPYDDIKGTRGRKPPSERDAMARRRTEGATLREVAREFGVTKQAVSQAVKRAQEAAQ